MLRHSAPQRLLHQRGETPRSPRQYTSTYTTTAGTDGMPIKGRHLRHARSPMHSDGVMFDVLNARSPTSPPQAIRLRLTLQNAYCQVNRWLADRATFRLFPAKHTSLFGPQDACVRRKPGKVSLQEDDGAEKWEWG